MEKNQVLKAIEAVQQHPKRKFTQSYDLIINLKNVLIKQSPVDLFVTLPFPKGKKVKIAAFVDQQLVEQAQKHCDLVIKDTEFSKYADKKIAKKLAEEYDYFIAQVNVMPKVAAAVGKFLGTRGKMPNPKLGGVVPPNVNLELLCKKLRQTVHLQAKKATNIQCLIGKENQSKEEIAENFLTVYTTLLKSLPNEEQNIKDVSLKLTMSKPVRVA